MADKLLRFEMEDEEGGSTIPGVHGTGDLAACTTAELFYNDTMMTSRSHTRCIVKNCRRFESKFKMGNFVST
jgi:hypothetical protein